MINRPMKGEQIDDLSRVKFPVYAFPKIDGFRCVLAHRPLTSRLSPFPNKHFDKEATGILPEGHILDGEVVVGKKRGKNVLGRTSSGVTRREGKPDWTLWVFDRPFMRDAPGFHTRYLAAAGLVASVDHPRVRLLKCKRIENLEQLERYIEKKLRKGYEGVMIRSVDGPYKEGKATINQGWLLKIKPFEDFEVRITGYYEEMENTNEAKREATGKLKRSSAKAGKVGKGTLGGFIGKELKTGKQARVGGGFTKRQRKAFWAIRDELVEAGAVMKCKKQTVGEKDKPRHPTFLSLRPEFDTTDY